MGATNSGYITTKSAGSGSDFQSCPESGTERNGEHATSCRLGWFHFKRGRQSQETLLFRCAAYRRRNAGSALVDGLAEKPGGVYAAVVSLSASPSRLRKNSLRRCKRSSAAKAATDLALTARLEAAPFQNTNESRVFPHPARAHSRDRDLPWARTSPPPCAPVCPRQICGLQGRAAAS